MSLPFTRSDMKPLFQRVANNGFLQERQNVSNEMPYNHRFYKGVRNFTLVVWSRSAHQQDLWVIQMIEYRIWR